MAVPASGPGGSAGPITEGTTDRVLLHLAARAGACLAVCDVVCARRVVHTLGATIEVVTSGLPPPQRHCAGCGGLIDEPTAGACLRHLDGCPVWDYSLTSAAAAVLRRLAIDRGQSLSDEGVVVLTHTLELLAHTPAGLNPELAYHQLLTRLPPP